MPIQLEREWIVVHGDRIAYRADSRSDAEQWATKNGGEAVAIPANFNGGVI